MLDPDISEMPLKDGQESNLRDIVQIPTVRLEHLFMMSFLTRIFIGSVGGNYLF